MVFSRAVIYSEAAQRLGTCGVTADPLPAMTHAECGMLAL